MYIGNLKIIKMNKEELKNQIHEMVCSIDFIGANGQAMMAMMALVDNLPDYYEVWTTVRLDGTYQDFSYAQQPIKKFASLKEAKAGIIALQKEINAAEKTRWGERKYNGFYCVDNEPLSIRGGYKSE